MKINKTIPKGLIFLFILSLSFALESGGGGKNRGGDFCGGKNQEPCPDTACESITEKTVEFYPYGLWDVPQRYRFGNPPSYPQFGDSTAPATSASNCYSYFCVITVSSPQCASYTRTFVWNVTGNQKMNIQIPTNIKFRVSADYFETSHFNWTNTSFDFGRGVWTFEKVYNHTPSNIFVNRWLYQYEIRC